jgi:hypothetical protein
VTNVFHLSEQRRSQFSWRVSSASSRVWSLASPYRREPSPRLHRAPLGALVMAVLSLDQRLVGETLSGYAINESVQPSKRVVLDVPFVQSEGEFVDIAIQVLRTRMMIDADDAALENREDAFHPVRGHVIANILSRAVIDGIVLKPRAFDANVSTGFIRMNDGAGLYVLINRVLNRLFVSALDRHGAGASAAFAHSENRGLAHSSATSLELLGFVLVLFNAADVGLVNLDDALKLREVRAASLAQTMQHKPRRFLRDADFLRKLHGRNALARRHKEIHRVNPLMQRHMAALKDGSGPNREVLFAGVAAIVSVLAHGDALARATNRAARAILPKPAFEIHPRGFLIGEHLEKLESGDGALGHQYLSLGFWDNPSPRSQGSQVYKSLDLGGQHLAPHPDLDKDGEKTARILERFPISRLHNRSL